MLIRSFMDSFHKNYMHSFLFFLIFPTENTIYFIFNFFFFSLIILLILKHYFFSHAHTHQICDLPLHMMQWQNSLENSNANACEKYTVDGK